MADQPIIYPLFSARNSLGLPLAGGQLFSYAAGTTTPQPTYTDSTGSTPNANPVILNARGEAPVWLNPDLTYKFVLADQFGNQLWTADNVPGGYLPGLTLDASIIGQFLWPRTPAEVQAGVTPSNYGYPSGNVLRYGADPTGASDSTIAFVAASNVVSQQLGAQEIKSGVVYIPVGLYTFSTALTFPNGTILQGEGCFNTCVSPTFGPQGGTILQFANNVAGAAITMGDGTANLTASVRNLSISRAAAAGAPPAATIGLLINGGFNVVIDTVLSYNHDIGIQFNNTDGVHGSQASVINFYTGYIGTCHFVANGWNGVSTTNSRFGMAGVANNLGAVAYIRCQGGTAGATGPASIGFNGCTFAEEATPGAQFWWEFFPTTGTPGLRQASFNAVNCLVASVNVQLITSTISWTQIFGMNLTGNSFITGGAQTLGLNNITQPQDWNWAGNLFDTAGTSFSSTAALEGVNISGNTFTGPFSCTGVAGSYLNLTGNSFGGTVTLAGAFQSVELDGNQGSGTFLYTATSTYVDIRGAFGQGAWTPQLNFGGAHAGMTQTVASGIYVMTGQYIHCQFEIQLSALGSSTGNATVSGLPYPCKDNLGGGVMTNASNMSLLASSVTLSSNSGTSTMGFGSTGSSGTQALTNGNFTGTSIFYCHFTYKWQ